MALSKQAVKKHNARINNTKRYGNHHKHTKPFLKTYYPYLPLFGIAAFLIIFMGVKVLGGVGAVLGTITVSIGLAAVVL